MPRQKILDLKTIIEEVSREQINKRGARLIAQRVMERIENEIKEGNPIHLGVGKLRKVWVEERKGRNPKTGEEITIPPHYTVKFRISRKFKEKLNSA